MDCQTSETLLVLPEEALEKNREEELVLPDEALEKNWEEELVLPDEALDENWEEELVLLDEALEGSWIEWSFVWFHELLLPLNTYWKGKKKIQYKKWNIIAI